MVFKTTIGFFSFRGRGTVTARSTLSAREPCQNGGDDELSTIQRKRKNLAKQEAFSSEREEVRVLHIQRPWFHPSRGKERWSLLRQISSSSSALAKGTVEPVDGEERLVWSSPAHTKANVPSNSKCRVPLRTLLRQRARPQGVMVP